MYCTRTDSGDDLAADRDPPRTNSQATDSRAPALQCQEPHFSTSATSGRSLQPADDTATMFYIFSQPADLHWQAVPFMLFSGALFSLCSAMYLNMGLQGLARSLNVPPSQLMLVVAPCTQVFHIERADLVVPMHQVDGLSRFGRFFSPYSQLYTIPDSPSQTCLRPTSSTSMDS